MLEMIAALTLTLVGFVGLLNLQTASIQGAADARSLFQAMQLGEHFAETLRTEAVEWTNSSTQSYTQTHFLFLKNAPVPAADNSSSGWIVATPAYVNVLGNFSTYDAGVMNEFPAGSEARFCIHYQLTWVMADLLLRADVRVLWVRPGGRRVAWDECPPEMADDPEVQFVSIPITIMQNVFVN